MQIYKVNEYINQGDTGTGGRLDQAKEVWIGRGRGSFIVAILLGEATTGSKVSKTIR